MFRVLSNQHHQPRTNQKLRFSEKKIQNRGVCGQAFPSLGSPVIPFFFCSRPNVLDELAPKRLLRKLKAQGIFWPPAEGGSGGGKKIGGDVPYFSFSRSVLVLARSQTREKKNIQRLFTG